MRLALLLVLASAAGAYVIVAAPPRTRPSVVSRAPQHAVLSAADDDDAEENSGDEQQDMPAKGPLAEENSGDEQQDMRAKGPLALLSGLPWWFPVAIGWLLAPQVVPEGMLPDDIFAAPTAQQERTMLRDERSLASDMVERELYGR